MGENKLFQITELSGLISISSPNSVSMIPSTGKQFILKSLYFRHAFSVEIVQSFFWMFVTSLCRIPSFLLNAVSVQRHTKFLHFKEENRLSE